MIITENQRLLSLLMQTLRDTLTPELSSSNAQAISGIMQAVLADMLNRQTHTAAKLLGLNERGRDLAAQITEMLATAGGTASENVVLVADTSASFDTLRAEHSQLTAKLTTLADQLVALRGLAGSATQQVQISDLQISDLLLQAAQWERAYYLDPQPTTDAVAAKPQAAPLTKETLLAFVRAHHPDGEAVEITAFQPIPGGFGKQTSKFTLHDAVNREQVLIARKSDPQPMLSHAGFIIENEFHLLRTVSAAGYPAPKPLWLGTNVAGVDASFYVMECMPGQIPGSFLGGLGQNAADDAASSLSLFKDVAQQLGRLHALSLETFADYIREHDDPALLDETVERCYRRQIEQWSRYVQERQLSSPFLHYLFDWLRENVPQDHRRPVLLHGDFYIHNLLVEHHKVSGVLDWECAMFGAPEQDLAYIQPHISQQLPWDDFLAAYHTGGARELDCASMPFHLAFSSLRQNIAMVNATRNLQTGANDDIRYAMVELGFGARFMELALAGTQGLSSHKKGH